MGVPPFAFKAVRSCNSLCWVLNWFRFLFAMCVCFLDVGIQLEILNYVLVRPRLFVFMLLLSLCCVWLVRFFVFLVCSSYYYFSVSSSYYYYHLSSSCYCSCSCYSYCSYFSSFSSLMFFLCFLLIILILRCFPLLPLLPLLPLPPPLLLLLVLRLLAFPLIILAKRVSFLTRMFINGGGCKQGSGASWVFPLSLSKPCALVTVCVGSLIGFAFCLQCAFAFWLLALMWKSSLMFCFGPVLLFSLVLLLCFVWLARLFFLVCSSVSSSSSSSVSSSSSSSCSCSCSSFCSSYCYSFFVLFFFFFFVFFFFFIIRMFINGGVFKQGSGVSWVFPLSLPKPCALVTICVGSFIGFAFRLQCAFASWLLAFMLKSPFMFCFGPVICFSSCCSRCALFGLRGFVSLFVLLLYIILMFLVFFFFF